MDKAAIRRRKTLQWFMLVPSVFVLALGWKFPMLGLWVMGVMTVGIVGGIMRGRWVCGNLCPRGAIFDQILARMSMNRPLPKLIRGIGLRLIVWPALFGFMIYNVTKNPTSVEHWGSVMWRMCAVTTAVGFILGVVYNWRVWCVLCPIGNLAYVTGGTKCALTIDAEKCTDCRVCEKKCSMQVPVTEYRKDDGRIVSSRCIQCGVCADSCPSRAIDRNAV